MLEIEVLYEDGHREKQSLKNIRKLKTDKVQYIIVWKDDLILREVCSYDFYYIIWDKDWIILEGFDQREAGKVYFKKNEPNKTENRDYIEITRMAIKLSLITLFLREAIPRNGTAKYKIK